MTATLNAREVYQVLKEIALEVRQITQLSPGDGGVVHVQVDGWTISLHNEGNELDLCFACTAADGRSADAHSWQRFGTDPVQLLSRWEHEQLQRLLSVADAKGLLLAGATSAPTAPVDASYFEALRTKVRNAQK